MYPGQACTLLWVSCISLKCSLRSRMPHTGLKNSRFMDVWALFPVTQNHTRSACLRMLPTKTTVARAFRTFVSSRKGV